VLTALESHKSALRKRVAHLERLIDTVEQTMAHLKGECKMSEKQLFDVFNDAQQAWANLASGGLNATMNLAGAATAGGMTAMSAAGAGGGSATTINNSVSMSMPTTINNGMDAAAFQARVLQTVTRAVRGY